MIEGPEGPRSLAPSATLTSKLIAKPASKLGQEREPQKPTLTGRSRLNEHLFFSMSHARAVIAGWAADYNLARPHSSIGYRTPAAYAAPLDPQRAPALRHLESSAPMPVAAVPTTRNPHPGTSAGPG